MLVNFQVDDIIPDIVYNGNGMWVVMWQSQEESSLLYFSVSNDSGNTWSQQNLFLDKSPSQGFQIKRKKGVYIKGQVQDFAVVQMVPLLLFIQEKQKKGKFQFILVFILV